MPSSISSFSSLLHYQQFLIVGILFMSVWYALLLQQQQKQKQHQDQPQTTEDSADYYNYNNYYYYHILITYAPLWLIVGLGWYALLSVMYGTLTFHDTPEAAEELEQHIHEAKQEMIKRGIILPSSLIDK
jgi:hypothetical protein